MKYFKSITLLVVLIVMAVAVMPVYAQLGDTDTSTFTVQNISGGSATVTVTFYAENGTAYTPTDLGGGVTNPFTLADGVSQQVNVANVPTAQLPTGRYSLVISSTGQIVAQAGLAGSGTLRFGGSYDGFSAGATTVYIPSIAYNLFGWYSMITVQNLDANPADVTVTLTCTGGATGTLTQNNIPSMSSYTWALKNVVPTGFTASTVCDGSAVITSDNKNIVAVNNQNNPSTGATNTFEGASSGGNPLYVPSLSNNYFGWNSNLSIVKLGSGNTTVTVSYSDGDPDDTCNLTDAAPGCKLYQPSNHTVTGRYGATISATGGMQLLAIVGSTNGSLSGATSAVAGGSATVAIPNVSKSYYGWDSAINCQVVGGAATTLHVSYAGYAANAYDTAQLLIGGSIQIQVKNESFLPASWQGGATITANDINADVACTVGNSNATNAATTPGDWTTQYNAFNR